MQLIIIIRWENLKIKSTKSLKYNRESERMKMEYSDQALKLEAGFNQIRQDLEKEHGDFPFLEVAKRLNFFFWTFWKTPMIKVDSVVVDPPSYPFSTSKEAENYNWRYSG